MIGPHRPAHPPPYSNMAPHGNHGIPHRNWISATVLHIPHRTAQILHGVNFPKVNTRIHIFGQNFHYLSLLPPPISTWKSSSCAGLFLKAKIWVCTYSIKMCGLHARAAFVQTRLQFEEYRVHRDSQDLLHESYYLQTTKEWEEESLGIPQKIM